MVYELRVQFLFDTEPYALLYREFVYSTVPSRLSLGLGFDVFRIQSLRFMCYGFGLRILPDDQFNLPPIVLLDLRQRSLSRIR